MGHEGAPWLDRPEREAEERPSRAIQELKLEPGMVVADFGAGSGYYTERLARAVGPTGRVLAVDLQPEMLQWWGRARRSWGSPTSSSSGVRPTTRACRPASWT